MNKLEGEIILVGLLIVAGLLLALFGPGVLPWWAQPEEPVNPPGWSFEGWYQHGNRVSIAKVVEPVTLKLELSSGSTPVVGNMMVKIKKDIRFGEDVVETSIKLVNLLPKSKETVEMEFTPHSTTGLFVREYFFKLYWNGVSLYDPTTPGQRHGLQVEEE